MISREFILLPKAVSLIGRRVPFISEQAGSSVLDIDLAVENPRRY